MVQIATIFVGLLGFVAIVSIPLAWLYIKRLEFPEVGDTVVILRDTNRTNGSMICYLVDKQTGRNGRIIFRLLPAGIENAKPFPYIAEANKVKPYPKGTWDKNKNVIEVFPNTAVEFYANIFGDIETKNAENSIIYAQRKGLSRQQSHLDDIGEGELSRQNLNLMKRFLDVAIERNARDDKAGRPGSYPSTGGRDSFT